MAKPPVAKLMDFSRINPEHKKRNRIRQLKAHGYMVTLEPVGSGLPAL
jgi:translation initiation factor IF-3